jgi:hypothetical protein
MIREVPVDPTWGPIISEERSMKKFDLWDEMGVYAVFGGVDWERYKKHEVERKPGEEDLEWVSEKYYFNYTGRRKWGWMPIPGTNLTGSRIVVKGAIDGNNGKQVSELEVLVRKYIFETVLWLRKNVPGFENAYLFFISPYLGGRGGPCIKGEYTLTIEDLKEGRRFNDVMHVYFLENLVIQNRTNFSQTINPEGCDIPFRIMLPKNVNGLLVVGRGASFIRRGHDPQVRDRNNLYLLGEEAGIAASIAVKNSVTPRNINVKELQTILLKKGFRLGDDNRLKELELI